MLLYAAVRFVFESLLVILGRLVLSLAQKNARNNVNRTKILFNSFKIAKKIEFSLITFLHTVLVSEITSAALLSGGAE